MRGRRRCDIGEYATCTPGRITAACALLFPLLAVPCAVAQGYPASPVRVVVPFPAGGGNDSMGRLLAQKLTETLGKSFYVENRAGANGMVGSEFVARAPKDGYTLLVNGANFVTTPSLYPKATYDPLRQFEPISLIAIAPNVLVVHPSVPAKTAKEFIALVKAKPDQIAYSSAGTGSTAFLAAELFKLLTGTRMLHVPYKGTSPALTAILSGETQASVVALPGAVPHIKSGKLRALGVTSAKRATNMKDLPTMIEAGVKDFDFETWYGLFGPGGLPRDIVTRANGSTNKVLGLAEVRDVLLKQGIDPAGGTPEAFDKIFRAEIVTLGKVIKASGAKPET